MIELKNVYTPTGKAPAEHIEFLYQLLMERPAEANISHQAMPSFAEHANFVRSRPYREWFLICESDAFVGAIYVTWNNEIGVFVLKKARRLGYAVFAVNYIRLNLSPMPPVPSARSGNFVAHVAPGNTASKALFERLGGKLIQVTYQL